MNPIMIPAGIIQAKEVNSKRVLVYCSIICSDWDGDNIEKLVKNSLYSTHRRTGGVIDQFENLVDWFKNNRYIGTDTGNNRQCTVIYRSEYDTIMSAKRNGNNFNHADLLLVLSYVRLYIIQQSGFPEIYYGLLKSISENIGLSVRRISSALSSLHLLGILYNQELPRYMDSSGCWHSNVRIFVNMKHDEVSYNWKHELNRGIEYITANQID